MRDRTAGTDTFDQQPPAVNGQPGITVGHEDLRLRLDQDLHRPRLCTVIVDRLTFGGNIIETGTDSYRLATTRAQAERAVV